MGGEDWGGFSVCPSICLSVCNALELCGENRGFFGKIYLQHLIGQLETWLGCKRCCENIRNVLPKRLFVTCCYTRDIKKSLISTNISQQLTLFPVLEAVLTAG